MPRKKKQQIKINNGESLEGLMQEIYNDACSQINDAQRTINELSNSTTPEDVDDATKIAKEKTNAQKIKEGGIKIKLEVAKLNTDLMKHNGNMEETSQTRVSGGLPSLDDFKGIREMMKDVGNNNDETE